MKTLRSITNLKDKKVLVRVDFNVPIKNGVVEDYTRISAVLPTLEYLIKNKAKIILIAHLGRPGGKVIANLKLDPIAKALGKMLKKRVRVLDTGNWKFTKKKETELRQTISQMKNGEVIMFDNIRFSADEKHNTGSLALQLASFGDLFVFDGFAVAHRASASVVGIGKILPSYAGILLEKEIKGLDRVIKKPNRPAIAIMGGIKVETKVPVIKSILPKVNNLLVGGAIFNTYLKAKKYEVGESLVDDKYLKPAVKICKKRKVILPVDVIVGTKDGTKYRIVDVKKKRHRICNEGEAIYDIGPQTICLYSSIIKKAQTLIWNGAVGYFEQNPYNIGTLSMARLVASRSKGRAYGVVGGGETILSLDMVQMSEFVDLVSTGGGAMLEYLSGKKLPGIEMLKNNKFKLFNN